MTDDDNLNEAEATATNINKRAAVRSRLPFITSRSSLANFAYLNRKKSAFRWLEGTITLTYAEHSLQSTRSSSLLLAANDSPVRRLFLQKSSKKDVFTSAIFYKILLLLLSYATPHCTERSIV
jgi:hypothetical protein